MSTTISEKYHNDGKLNGCAFSDKSIGIALNGRCRSKSLSSDKLNKTNADRAAILEDVESNYFSEKTETPGCLVVQNKVMDQGQTTINGFKDASKVTYGTDSPTRGRRVIFCVHGNPSVGCCAVIEDDVDGRQERNGNLTWGELHCHRSRNVEIDKRARRKLIIASVLCVVFMIGEVIGGYLSNSLAIATDAAHLLTDFASFMISLFALWVAARPATRQMSFGWHRAEVIGALTSVLLIWVVTGILVYMAVQRVITREFEIDATVMLITSGIGVLVNLVMGLTLHQHGHSHGGKSSHGHGHAHNSSNPVLNNKTETQEGDVESSSHQQVYTENINVRAAFIHVLGDFLQSFGVFVAAIVIYFKPDWDLVDPICTFLFSILVLITTFNIIKDALLVLMEGSPRGIDFQDVANTLLSLPDVVRVHNLRMWALSLDKTALSAHLAIRTGVSPQKVLEEATQAVHKKYNFFEMTLQIEEFNDVMEKCSQCIKAKETQIFIQGDCLGCEDCIPTYSYMKIDDELDSGSETHFSLQRSLTHQRSIQRDSSNNLLRSEKSVNFWERQANHKTHDEEQMRNDVKQVIPEKEILKSNFEASGSSPVSDPRKNKVKTRHKEMPLIIRSPVESSHDVRDVTKKEEDTKKLQEK